VYISRGRNYTTGQGTFLVDEADIDIFIKSFVSTQLAQELGFPQDQCKATDGETEESDCCLRTHRGRKALYRPVHSATPFPLFLLGITSRGQQNKKGLLLGKRPIYFTLFQRTSVFFFLA